MTTETARQQILRETRAARDGARTMLRHLINARVAAQAHGPSHTDGESRPIDRAIESTEQMIAVLEESIEDVRDGLTEDDLAPLD